MVCQSVLETNRATLHDVYTDCDATFATLAQRTPVACTAGCAACCVGVVTATELEADNVAAAVERLPDSLRRAVVGRLHSWASTWQRVTRGASAQRVSRGLPTYLAWQRERIGCPMLDPSTHRCLVYADRPLLCRTHHACQPEAGSVALCGRCPMATPGDGCFGAREQAHGHPPALRLVSPTFEADQQAAYVARLGPPRVGILPALVLAAGESAYAWGSMKPKPLYRLAHAHPEG